MKKIEQYFEELNMKKLAVIAAVLLGVAIVIDLLFSTPGTLAKNRFYSEGESAASEAANELVSCINARDAGKIEDLFSEAARESSDIDGEVKELLSLIDGSLSKQKITVHLQSGAYRKDGSTRFSENNIIIDKAETPIGSVYSIEAQYSLSPEEPEKTGLTRVTAVKYIDDRHTRIVTVGGTAAEN